MLESSLTSSSLKLSAWPSISTAARANGRLNLPPRQETSGSAYHWHMEASLPSWMENGGTPLPAATARNVQVRNPACALTICAAHRVQLAPGAAADAAAELQVHAPFPPHTTPPSLPFVFLYSPRLPDPESEARLRSEVSSAPSPPSLAGSRGPPTSSRRTSYRGELLPSRSLLC